ncbi:mammalian cell entry protein [Mycolicibacterium anyangense]|uniref:Mammalian cell entry protein n=1 Tax=Mycolicibacterium anyangense TaxID=1431246 RepID=A0A6N4W9X9_9MYCO|nr:mammalian cell entry protein [Mycolicibacterium anyangense]
MCAKVKSFSERNPIVVGAIGLGLTLLAVLIALQYRNLPFLNSDKQYTAYFSEAGGLNTNSAVQVSGYKVGQVSSVKLDGNRVVVNFKVDKTIRLGERTEAIIKTKSLLGSKILEVVPRGDGNLSGPIPLDRTTPPYQLADALGDLSSTVEAINTDQLSTSLSTLAETFSKTPPELQVAVQGLARFSTSLNNRDEQLRTLLANANKATKVLAARSDQVVSLISDSNALLGQLRNESAALDQIAGNLSAVSKQLSGFVGENRETFRPTIDRLNVVLGILANRKERIQLSLHRLNAYALALGESVSSGPWFSSYIANLMPGQFVQPFIDAAFSDLGLDPSVLLPSQLHNPQTGQPATPALPMPFPRTGQGGEPNLNLPDAITGNPGDPRYPYREPLPAPPPGGPPPGPPAGSPLPAPTPTPFQVLAPGEVAPTAEPGS